MCAVLGCPDMKAPPGGWVKHSDDVATLGCSSTAQTWRMVCRGAEWVGDTKNCSIGMLNRRDAIVV